MTFPITDHVASFKNVTHRRLLAEPEQSEDRGVEAGGRINNTTGDGNHQSAGMYPLQADALASLTRGAVVYWGVFCRRERYGQSWAID